MNQDNMNPEEQLKSAIRSVFQDDVLPLLERRNSEIIENRVLIVAKGLQQQLQDYFDKAEQRFKTLENLRPAPSMVQNGSKPETVGNRASYTLDIGSQLVDTIVKAATTIIPLWNNLQASKYAYGLTAEKIAEIRLADPVRAMTLGQLFNPDPMMAQLPTFAYNMMTMGAQAGLRMKNAMLPQGGSPSPTSSGLPGSTSAPGSPTTGLLPMPATPQPAPSSASMSAPVSPQLISEALRRAEAKLLQRLRSK